MDSDSCVLAWDDPGPLLLTFHRTTRVGDHEDASRQTVATAVEHTRPCKLTRWPPDGDEKTYLLPLDCPSGRALTELDAFGIRAWTGRPTEAGVKLEIKVEGENVAFPPLSRWEQPPAPATRPQDYFFVSSSESETDGEWIHGIAVKEEPRLVRQFVVRNDGTGASIQHQVTGEVVPEKMGVVEIEATFSPRSLEVIPGSPTPSSSLQSSGDSEVAAPAAGAVAAVPRMDESRFYVSQTYESRTYEPQTYESRTYEPETYESRTYEPQVDDPENQLDTGKLEILPGGLIAQPLSKDPGTYDWVSQPRSKLTVRIVNFEQFRSITGQEAPTLPQLPRGPRLRRRDARNPEGTDSVLASNAEYQFKHQAPGDEFAISSTSSGGGGSILPEKGDTKKPNGGGPEALQLQTTNPAVTNNGTTGHTVSTEGTSGGGRPKQPTSEATTGKGEVSGSKEMRGGNGNAKSTSGSCNCCTCM